MMGAVVETRRGEAEADEGRWEAVLRRDRRADGVFWYSVSTTGIYCRPSCPAKRPLRGHVRFHATREEAERAGFRACRRCRPDAPGLEARHASAVTRACRLIEDAEEMPGLAALAAAAGMSRFYFHRTFKAHTGVTPRAYAAAHRARRVRDALAEGGAVTSAIFAAGFNSSGRFYAGAPAMLGMTPRTFGAGGTGERIQFAVDRCSLGLVLVAATGKGICAIFLGDDRDTLLDDLTRRFRHAQLTPGDRSFHHLVAAVVRVVDAPALGERLPLDVRGTAFQLRVWEALRRIPPASTASYTEIAARIGAPTAVRAVAQACGANPVAVAIPCHRVVRQDGSLCGYRWGLERKRALLDVEDQAAGRPPGGVARRKA
jgi:AraC family transcriptional regulator, regulatory protein of adaptative response / methylated-DNA-[protein]-cysteine methyltransferase